MKFQCVRVVNGLGASHASACSGIDTSKASVTELFANDMLWGKVVRICKGSRERRDGTSATARAAPVLRATPSLPEGSCTAASAVTGYTV